MCNLRLPLQGTALQIARELLLLADDDQFVAAKLFSGNGGMAWIQEGRIQAFRPAASFLVQFEAQTPLRSEAALSQALEAFAGLEPAPVSIMAPKGSQELLRQWAINCSCEAPCSSS